MLCKAAAMLVTLAAFLAVHLNAVAFFGVLDKGLAVAGSAHARLVRLVQVVVAGHLVGVVFDGTLLYVGDGFVGGQARGRGWEAADAGFGRGVAACGPEDGHGGRRLGGAGDSGGEGGEARAGVGDGLASGDAVGGVDNERMRIGAGVGLAAGGAGGRGAGEGRAHVHQWPRGLMNLLEDAQESSARLGLAGAASSQQRAPQDDRLVGHTFEEAIANDPDCFARRQKPDRGGLEECGRSPVASGDAGRGCGQAGRRTGRDASLVRSQVVTREIIFLEHGAGVRPLRTG